jgi:hypothetical protein
MINLLWILVAIFIIMWIVGFSMSFTFGGLIHILLALAVITVLVRIILGRRLA